MKINIIIQSLLLAALASCGFHQGKTVFTIGSGSKDAMYFPVASALCDTFNKHNKDKNIICEARVSSGAEYNLDAVENGEFDMGMAQESLQKDAYDGRKKFFNRPHKNLKNILTLHREYLTIIAKNDVAISNFHDLRGKRINIGNPGSGSRILFLQMIAKLGWKLSDFKEIFEESGSNISKVLCDSNKAEAAIYIVGHPNKSFDSMLRNCNARLVGLSKQEIKLFLSLAPKEFFSESILREIYDTNSQDIKTFASKTVLVVSAKLNPKIVDNFTRVLMENKEELIYRQPSLAKFGLYGE